MSEHNSNRKVGVHWFRHGLRFHDNPALVELLQNCQVFIPIFIFDGHCGFSGAKSVSPNRTRFLLECLQDLSVQLKSKGGQLYVCNKAEPCEVLRRIKQEIGLFQLSFDEDYEPIWHARDEKVRRFCREEGIDTIEHGSHTLWDPRIVIDTNGGVPPLTYQMFLHTVKVIGPPPRPVEDIDWSTIEFGTLLTFASDSVEALESALGSEAVGGRNGQLIRWRGGESQALAQLEHRAAVEAQAFRQGMYLPNQAAPDLLGPPMSLSPALSAGCLSVRRFYWCIHDLYASIHHGHTASCENITGQMVWREYFYTMSVDNKCYGQVLNNPICLDVTWRNATEGKRDLERWKQGATGYPFIDAAMRQLKLEGWIHHVARNAVACFLTRGDLWLNWEEGLAHFLEHLIDADWSVCAGNWLWVSSSAFEQLLDCDQCICPVNYGRRLDPYGEYVKRYVPEVRNLPVQYVYEPWKASLEVQGKAGCIIGKDYPERIVNHQIASQKNRQMMLGLRNSLLELRQAHCRPSSVEEVRQFMWLPEKLNHSCHRVAA